MQEMAGQFDMFFSPDRSQLHVGIFIRRRNKGNSDLVRGVHLPNFKLQEKTNIQAVWEIAGLKRVNAPCIHLITYCSAVPCKVLQFRTDFIMCNQNDLSFVFDPTKLKRAQYFTI